MKKIIYLLLTILLLYNAYLFRVELQIKSDVNDNSFQFALINEQKQILDKAFAGKTSFFYLFDNFNIRWNEGFSLNMYYAHLPQAVIAILGYIKILSLFEWFKLVKYLLLVFLPLSFFISARKLNFTYVQSLFAAVFSQMIFTDGLYGIDLTSYLWRGWGLFSQQLAVFFLPLAFAWTISYLESNSKDLSVLIYALIFNYFVAQSHVGIFLMLALCYPLWLIIIVMIPSKVERDALSTRLLHFVRNDIRKLFILAFSLFFLLAYFLIPFFLYSNYRNFSYWDSVWKFNSFGWFQIVSWFFSGALFDFNRLPVLTFIIIFGLFYYLKKIDKRSSSIDSAGGFIPASARPTIKPSNLRAVGTPFTSVTYRRICTFLVITFFFYFVLFFGRADLGKLIDLVPGLSEFHLHRFIVMVQMVAIFIGAGFLGEIVGLIKPKKEYLVLASLFFLFLFLYAQKPIVQYVADNNKWIKMDNLNYQNDLRDYQKLIKKLNSLPLARVYAGRPGNWGRELKVGGTQVYMALARDGFATVGFAPESWSPNSEYDQFFNEYTEEHFNLYNIKYVVAGTHSTPQKFYQLIGNYGKYNLYSVRTDGWFGFGRSKSTVAGNKNDFINIVKYWFEYIWPMTKQYPRISFKTGDKNNINLINQNSYNSLYGRFTLWQQSPFFLNDYAIKDKIKTDELADLNNYKVKFELKNDCTDCILILKNTFHPNWQVLVNGKRARIFPVFPFNIAMSITIKGKYEVEAFYRPGRLKVFLLITEIIVITVIIVIKIIKRKQLI